MRTIDIRAENNDPINEIIFADAPADDERNVSYRITCSVFHSNHFFLDNGKGDYEVIRNKDIGNLIKALQKAQEIWEGLE